MAENNDVIKFTESEVTSIDEIRNNVSQIFVQIGQIQVEKRRRLEELDKSETKLYDELKEINESEESLFKELNTKYGDGQYNPKTGEFTPGMADEPQVPSAVV